MSSLYKQQLNNWKSSLEVKAKLVYDIGGSQDPIKGMTFSWDVEDYKIIDLPEPHVEKVKPDIAHDMNKPLTEVYPEADVIFMLGVMDYIICPNIALQNVAQLLKPDGYAWIEFPLFYGHHEPLMQEGCRYSEGCIMRLLDLADLNLQEIIRKPAGNGHLVQFMREDGQRLAKNYPYHDTVGFIVKVSK